MQRRTTYHHGNLYDALLDAAVRLIAEVGPKAFTLREVARRARVSHNAPYRHFQDKDELLAAVAKQGFEELTKAMLEAAESPNSALDRLKSAGLAYVAFALRRPEHFAVMFETSPFESANSESTLAAKESFHALLAFVQDCQNEGQLPSGDPPRLALLAWSMVHGIAKLAITGCLPYRSNAQILKFAKFVIDHSLPVCR